VSQEAIDALFDAIDADYAPAASGCDFCLADVALERDPGNPLILHVWIAHEDGCPLCPTGS
jgi:hypothetical protein